jgi:hypothetical protein
MKAVLKIGVDRPDLRLDGRRAAAGGDAVAEIKKPADQGGPEPSASACHNDRSAAAHRLPTLVQI